mmetsp:Transcript_57626/g.178938  ORF Transcript_57626/g.178938 Transcript_57626/m.178938 type:complete len:279 (-) Transcript_57626:1555-2391(-)
MADATTCECSPASRQRSAAAPRRSAASAKIGGVSASAAAPGWPRPARCRARAAARARARIGASDASARRCRPCRSRRRTEGWCRASWASCAATPLPAPPAPAPAVSACSTRASTRPAKASRERSARSSVSGSRDSPFASAALPCGLTASCGCWRRAKPNANTRAGRAACRLSTAITLKVRSNNPVMAAPADLEAHSHGTSCLPSSRSWSTTRRSRSQNSQAVPAIHAARTNSELSRGRWLSCRMRRAGRRCFKIGHAVPSAMAAMHTQRMAGRTRRLP